MTTDSASVPPLVDIPNTEVVDLLVALIRNACVNEGVDDSGHEDRSVATLADYFGVDGDIIEPHRGRQSVVYRVAGTDPRAPRLLLIPHLDVVPATASDWSHPPFAGMQRDGVVWGRGAVDMLNVTAAMAAAFRPYLRGETAPLPGDLIFAGVADEEAGGSLGARYLAEEHWDLVGCDYLLTEVAAPPFASQMGQAIPVTVAEKGLGWRRLNARGIPGHASQPHGTDNALLTLADAMVAVGTEPMPILITDEWLACVDRLGLEPGLAAALTDEDRVDDAIGELAAADPLLARWVHACTHMTFTPTLLQAGVKSNVVADRAEGSVDVRLLPGQTRGDVEDHLTAVFGTESSMIEVTPMQEFGATVSPAEGVLWAAIGEAATRSGMERPLIPMLTPVATDARFFRARGAVAYGVGLYDDSETFSDFLGRFHGIDERVSEESVGMTARFLADVIRNFGVGTG